MKKLGLALALGLQFAVPAAAQEVLKPVKLLSIDENDQRVTRQFFGKVVARQTVDLAFQVGGQVVEFPVISGVQIKKGDLVARLDVEPFERALRQTQIQLEQSQRAVERFKKLQGSAVSQVALDDAVTQAGLADVAFRRAEYDLKNATLTAPYDALVSTRIIENFASINAGTAVVRLHDMSELRIEIEVPEVLFQRGADDSDFEISAKFPSSDELFPITLREFDAETSTIGQTYKATFGLSAPEGLRILPGSSVTVTATLGSEFGQILVPPAAIAIANDGELSVLVFDPTDGDKGVLRSVPVTAEADYTGNLRIISGIEDGMEIVAMGVNSLENGQSVRRFDGFGE